jgi:unsaturated rhamnogalacturonyl hydrolase
MEALNMTKVAHIELIKKIDLVVNKLINLEEADVDSDKTTSTTDLKKGIIAKDFGIKIWDWPQGVGLYGLERLQYYYKDTRYDTFLDEWYKNNIKSGLPSRNINTTAPFLTLITLAERMGNKEYEKMCLDQAQWLMTTLPKTKEGGFQHVTSAIGSYQDVTLNDGELWVDTLFMTVLFLAKMGQKYSRKDWTSEAIKQVLIHIKYLYDKKTGLLYHGWSFNENNNFGGVFWCRGNSWFTFGLMEFLEICDGALDEGVKIYLLDTFKAQAKALKDLQASSGLWHTVLTDSSSYEEVSGSGAIATGLLKAIKLGILDSSYETCTNKAIAAICNNVDTDGTVLNVSAGTIMGSDVAHYKNIIIAPMAYGQSLSLVALCEALK